MRDGLPHAFLYNPFDVVMPVSCPLCQSEQYYRHICENCSDAIEKARFDDPFFVLSDGVQSYRGAVCFSYGHPFVKKLIFNLKEYAPAYTVRFAARKMMRASALFSLPPGTVFTFLPRTRIKKRYYGFDQSRLLAQTLARMTGGGAVSRSLLSRSLFSREQKKLSLSERRQNVKNAFWVRPWKKRCHASCHTIVLVDDVITTGSSFLAGASALHKAFPDARIFLLALASEGEHDRVVSSSSSQERSVTNGN